MRLSDLADLPFSYAEVGATRGALPEGYHHVRESARIGHGRSRFEEAGAAVLRWGMLRGAGARVRATTDVAEVGAEVIVGLGPVQAPCRVVYVLDEPTVGLDTAGYGWLARVMRAYADQDNRAVLWTCHDAEFAGRVSDVSLSLPQNRR